MLHSQTQKHIVHVCSIVKLRNTLCLCNGDPLRLCNRDTLCLCNGDTLCLCNTDTLCLCHRDAKSLTNRFENKNTGACGTSLCAEFWYGSDGDSHLGWGPCKSSVFDEKHTMVFVHVFVCIRYASVYILMHPYASVCVPKPTKYLLK